MPVTSHMERNRSPPFAYIDIHYNPPCYRRYLSTRNGFNACMSHSSSHLNVPHRRPTPTGVARVSLTMALSPAHLAPKVVLGGYHS